MAAVHRCSFSYKSDSDDNDPLELVIKFAVKVYYKLAYELFMSIVYK
jgi:hypothetical protein